MVRALLAVLVVTAAVRGLFLVEIAALPETRAPAADALFHDHMARVLVGLDAPLPDDVPDPHVGARPFTRPPLYPLALGVLYRVVDDHPLVPRALQALLSLLLVALVFARAARHGAIAASAAALLVGLAPSLLFFEGELLPAAPLALALVVLVLLAERVIERPTPRTTALLGVAGGLLVLTRPNLGLPFALVLVVALALAARRRARGFAIVVAAALVVIAPVTIRNLAKGSFVLVSANGATTLLYGNNPRADGVHMNLPDTPAFKGVHEVSPFTQDALRAAVSRNLGVPLDDDGLARVLTDEVARFVRTAPARAAALTLRKTALFFGPAVIGNNRDVDTAMATGRVTRALPVTMPLLFALGGAGAAFALTRRTTRARALLGLAVVVGTAGSVIPFVAAERFRVVLVGVLALLAAPLVEALVEAGRRRDLVRAAALLAPVVIVGALTHVPFVEVERTPARFARERARALARAGDAEGAARALERAVALDPDLVVAHRDRGYRALAARDPTAAMASFNRALELAAGDIDARAGRAVARALIGDHEGAKADLDDVLARVPDHARALENRARLALDERDLGTARDLVERARRGAPARADLAVLHLTILVAGGAPEEALAVVDALPRDVAGRGDVVVLAARALVQRGDVAGARARLDEALARSDDDAVRTERARLALATGEPARARALFDAVVARAPDDASAWANVALAARAMGDVDESIRAADRALALALEGRPAPPRAVLLESLARALLASARPDDVRRAVVVAEESVALAPGEAPPLSTALAAARRVGDRARVARFEALLARACASRPDAPGCAP